MNDNERLATIVRTAADKLELRLRDTNSKSHGITCVLDAFRDIASGIATADEKGKPAAPTEPYAAIEAAADTVTSVARAEAHVVVLKFLQQNSGARTAAVMGLEPGADFFWGAMDTLLRPVPRYVREALNALGWITYIDTDQPACLRAKR